MLSLAVINFFIGIFGSLSLFLIATFAEGVQHFSAPFFVLLIGLACALLSTLFGYVSTGVILAIYTVVLVYDLYRNRDTVLFYWNKRVK
ncbi:MAG: hypothetical protein DRG24_01855 [Epsilonproteobacteria bacterium]|nr:MAG: hypothetical protein DRG24_01855 [Campylobacterota bacterium]